MKGTPSQGVFFYVLILYTPNTHKIIDFCVLSVYNSKCKGDRQ
nr:MAG TPA_asm: hypothetical protein [Caudoviricetes sp.]